jgi:hypothetical protein
LAEKANAPAFSARTATTEALKAADSGQTIKTAVPRWRAWAQ